MSRILVVEDEAVIRKALRRLLERHGYGVDEAGSVEEALERGGLDGYDLVIADLRLPGAAGTALIAPAHPTPVLILTSYASVRSAVESMKLGAADYVAKPFDHDELLVTVRRLVSQGRQDRQRRALRSDLARSYPVEGMVGECPAMREVFERIARVAPLDTTVLVLGESGTGKELVARAIHERSARAEGPLVVVNCAAIPEALMEAEIFGHERGAFTGADRAREGLVEAAHGGTLFLDEVGELPPAAQAQLLRVLQHGEVRRLGAAQARRVDVRLIAATHRDLRAEVRAGRFREDLYFRLNVFEILLPPLRERGSDVERLARFLLDKTCRRLNRPALALGEDALAAIRAHDWPGNVRELENAIERAVILAEGGTIRAADLGLPQRRRAWDNDGGEPDSSLEAYFRRFVLENQDRMTESELARRLGISRKTLWERRQRMGLPRPRRSDRR